MPSKIVEYQCRICKRRFRGENDFERAEACEKSHKIPISVDKPEYNLGDRKSDYPLSVLIHFKDNTSARYYRK